MRVLQGTALKRHSIRQSMNRVSVCNERMTQDQKIEALRWPKYQSLWCIFSKHYTWIFQKSSQHHFSIWLFQFCIWAGELLAKSCLFLRCHFLWHLVYFRRNYKKIMLKSVGFRFAGFKCYVVQLYKNWVVVHECSQWFNYQDRTPKRHNTHSL